LAEVQATDTFSTEERAALSALSFLFVFTVVWWAFALWPSDADSSAALLRLREVCFGRSDSGLPDARGWLVLIGQPITMGIAVVVVWKESVFGVLRGLVERGWGRAGLLAAMAVVTIGLAATSLRVSRALQASTFDPSGALEAVERRMDAPVPEFALVDQAGVLRGAADLQGRPTLLTFAFGHCETLCPIMVGVVTRVAERLRADLGVRVVVITVDPWRDTPGRLPSLADQWNLSGPDLALSGSIEEVEAALEAFGIGISRDPRTGDVTHPGRILLIDASGQMRYAVPADPVKIEALLRTGF
jgi:cytochrome oxidase Cu insertion factor (SCO1/SenC/PrrC family)